MTRHLDDSRLETLHGGMCAWDVHTIAIDVCTGFDVPEKPIAAPVAEPIARPDADGGDTVAFGQ